MMKLMATIFVVGLLGTALLFFGSMLTIVVLDDIIFHGKLEKKIRQKAQAQLDKW